MSNKITGKRGEEIACGYLKKIGYTILERNVKFSRLCELDIIAKDKATTLIANEVKTRTSDICGSPLEAITKTKFEHIKQGVQYYLTEHKVKDFRIDVVGITLKPEIKIEHLKNVYL